jgi:hypothetical protein
MTGPNPQRLGACPGCGAWRSDGRPPYLHRDGCRRAGDPQLARWADDLRLGDHGGPVLDRPLEVSCDEHGPMVRDDIRSAWYCPQQCGAWLPDEEAVRLAAGAPADMPGALQITVT